MSNLAKKLEKINSELDISIESSENIINELSIQDKQIVKITKISESIEEKVTWSKYLINIINTYFGFLWVREPRFLYREDRKISEIDGEINGEINEVRKNSIKISDIIDRQNDKLTKQIDSTDKINDKISEVLINQINV
jgi:hypothetical protein